MPEYRLGGLPRQQAMASIRGRLPGFLGAQDEGLAGLELGRSLPLRYLPPRAWEAGGSLGGIARTTHTWLHELVRSQVVVSTAVTREAEDQWELIGWSPAPPLGLARAIDALDQDPRVSFEARAEVLVVASIYVRAVWVRGGHMEFLAVGDTPEDWLDGAWPGQVFTASEFLAVVAASPITSGFRAG